jgi:hypothetical protein
MMAASYESIRQDRRYEIDARGFTEFGPDQTLRVFIPWCSVDRVDFSHDALHKAVAWSVRSTDGGRIRPKLEYVTSLECYNVAIQAWRVHAPHAVRAHFERAYRQFRRAHVLIHLVWVVPALFVYGMLWLSHGLHLEVEREELKILSLGIPVAAVFCLLLNLFHLKKLRLGVDLWYALTEASWNDPANAWPASRVADLSGRPPKGSRFAFFRWLFPPPGDAFADKSTTPLERYVYRQWEVAAVLPFLVLITSIGYVCYLGLTRSASLIHHQELGTHFLVRPAPFYWAIPAFLLGLVPSVISLDWLYRALLRDRYRRFDQYCKERAGFDSTRLFACLAVCVVIGSALFSLAGLTSCTRFTDAGIEIQRPLSFRSSFHRYARVKSIEHRATIRAPIGTTVQRPHYVILFDDGSSWSGDEGLRTPVAELDSQIARLVSANSKRRIIEQP